MALALLQTSQHVVFQINNNHTYGSRLFFVLQNSLANVQWLPVLSLAIVYQYGCFAEEQEDEICKGGGTVEDDTVVYNYSLQSLVIWITSFAYHKGTDFHWV